MNKECFVSVLCAKTGYSKKIISTIINSGLDIIISTIAKGEKVQFLDFGTFEVRERAARIGRNPRTNERISIPASKVPVFKAGAYFKNAVKDG